MVGEQRNVALGELIVGEHAVRFDESDPEIIELADSIKRLGLLNPLIVRETDQGFIVLAGHRRYAACCVVPLTTVPVRVKDGDDADNAGVIFAENFYRKDPSPVELAQSIAQAVLKDGLSVEQVAATCSRSKAWVEAQLEICDWPDDVVGLVHSRLVGTGAGSWLARIEDVTYREFLTNLAAENGCTARCAEGWYRGWKANKPPEQVASEDPAESSSPAPTVLAQMPCFNCQTPHRPDGMSIVYMCPQCVIAVREAIEREKRHSRDHP